jgi:hypothetical protein
MNERIPIKQLFELKMTNWYISRTPMIQEAICRNPPGYYVYSGNGEIYRLIGWSDPQESKGETCVFIYLEREIVGGTERLRVAPGFISPEEELIELNQIQEEVIQADNRLSIGYNIGKLINGEVKYLQDEQSQSRFFTSIEQAKSFLLGHAMTTEEQLSDFIYEPLFV